MAWHHQPEGHAWQGPQPTELSDLANAFRKVTMAARIEVNQFTFSTCGFITEERVRWLTVIRGALE